MNLFKKTSFDVISIGDIVVDDFIKIKEAEIEDDEKNKRQEICLAFGDKIPYEANYLIPAVGNSANASVAIARLGLKSALISNLGTDEDASLCLKALKTARVDTNLIKQHSNLKTNRHYVLWFDDNRTILIKHEKYPYSLPKIKEPKWIYLSSLGENSLSFHEEIADYLEQHPQIKLAFQPGTYQIRFGAEKLSQIYKRAELFFCNKLEAQRILKSDTNDLGVLASGLQKLGPKIVFITDGKNGAYLFNDQTLKHFPIYPNIYPAIESTGAGDAFSATVTAGMILGLTIEESTKWALINSMSVVSQIGAQAGLLNQEKIKEFLAKAPTEFQPKNVDSGL